MQRSPFLAGDVAANISVQTPIDDWPIRVAGTSPFAFLATDLAHHFESAVRRARLTVGP